MPPQPGSEKDMDKQVYRYKIRLDSTADVIAFTKAAARCPEEIWLVNGHHRLSGKSYLGVALGQSIALGTCSALGAILGPVFTGHAGDLTSAVIIGVIVI